MRLRVVRGLVVGPSFRTVRNSMVGVLLGFASGVLSARMLGVEQRGYLALVLATAGMTSLVCALGSNVALRVNLWRDARASVARFFSVSCMLTMLQAIVMLAALVLLEPDAPSHTSAFIAALLLGFSTFLTQQTLDILNALGLTARSALLNSLGTGFSALGLLIATLVAPTLTAAIIAYCCGNLFVVAGCLLTYFQLPADQLPQLPRAPLDRTFLIRSGVPLLGLNLGQGLALKADHFFLAGLADLHAVGLYSVASALVAPMVVASGAIGQVAFANAARGISSPRGLVTQVAGALGIGFTWAAFVWLTGHTLVPALFGARYIEAVPILRILALAQIALAPYVVLTKYCAGAGRTRFASGSGVGLIVVLGTALSLGIPIGGAAGAAWACVGAFGVCSLWTVVIVTRMRSSTVTQVPPR